MCLRLVQLQRLGAYGSRDMAGDMVLNPSHFLGCPRLAGDNAHKNDQFPDNARYATHDLIDKDMLPNQNKRVHS